MRRNRRTRLSARVDTTEKSKEQTFRVGKHLLLWTPSSTSKMENEWEGPYSVIEKCDETTKEGKQTRG